LIFPDFPNIGVIDDIRSKYDPSAALVRPHVTLVFPFDSELTKAEIGELMGDALTGQQPFGMSLQGISGHKSFGNYLLLNVHKGKMTVKAIHNRLYSGILEQYKPSWCRTFEPHLTVGRVDDPLLFEQALNEVSAVQECFETCVAEICVEIILPDGASMIESVWKLSGQAAVSPL
jgi:2'-5' RNA ligase